MHWKYNVNIPRGRKLIDDFKDVSMFNIWPISSMKRYKGIMTSLLKRGAPIKEIQMCALAYELSRDVAIARGIPVENHPKNLRRYLN